MLRPVSFSAHDLVPLHGYVIDVFCCFFFFFLLVDVITERLKVRQEAQEARRQVDDTKQEAETGSAKTVADGLASQLDPGEHKDAELQEEASSKGKSQFYTQGSLLILFSTSVLFRRANCTDVKFSCVQSDIFDIIVLKLYVGTVTVVSLPCLTC